MKLQAFIVNWENVYKNVARLESQFTEAGYAPTIINSWEFGKQHWLFVGDIRYYRQFYKALELFDSNNDYMLFCAGDISYNNWCDFFAKFKLVAELTDVGVYAPYFTNSPWNYPQTFLSNVDSIPGLHLASQTDGIFVILHRDIATILLEFFRYFETKVNLLNFTSGWGLDYIWSALSMNMGKYILRDAEATVVHPAGSSYDHGKATSEMGQILEHFSSFAFSKHFTRIGEFYKKIAERMGGLPESTSPSYFYESLPAVLGKENVPYHIISISNERAYNIDKIKEYLGRTALLTNINSTNGYDDAQIKRFRKKFPGVSIVIDKPGEIGCFASHYEFWNFVANSDDVCLDNVIVFEDDALIENFFYYQYKYALENIPANYDVFSLYVDKDQHSRYNESEQVSFSISRGYQDWSTLCYFISKKGAQKLLKLVELHGMNQPVDWFMFRSGHSRDLDVYTWSPSVQLPVRIDRSSKPQIIR